MKILLSIVIFFIATSLFAQEGYEHLSPIAHGAGRTYSVTSRGLASVGLNPALLGIDDNDRTIEVQLFPASSFGIDAGPSFSDVNALSGVFSTGVGHFTDSSLTSIANLISNNKLSGRGDAEILGVAYYYPTVGTFAFTWTTHAAVRTDIPQSFLDFAKDAGTNLLTNPNSIENFDLQGIWYSEYSLSFGKNITIGLDTSTFLRNVSVGGAVKYVSGIAYLKVDEGNYIHTIPGNQRVTIGMNFDEHAAYSSNFDPQHVPNRFSFDFLTTNSAGSGLGADIGICLGLFSNHVGTPTVLFGMSATDIGYINWNQNATERIADHILDTINYGKAQKIEDVTDSLKKFGGLLKHVSSFTSQLPAMFRAGLLLDLDAMGIEWGAFSPRIAIEYANGLTSVVGSLKTGRLGAGITLEHPGNIALRLNGGFVIESGASDITLGAGATFLKIIDVDIATAGFSQLFKSSESRTDLALAVRVHF